MIGSRTRSRLARGSVVTLVAAGLAGAVVSPVAHAAGKGSGSTAVVSATWVCQSPQDEAPDLLIRSEPDTQGKQYAIGQIVFRYSDRDDEVVTEPFEPSAAPEQGTSGVPEPVSGLVPGEVLDLVGLGGSDAPPAEDPEVYEYTKVDPAPTLTSVFVKAGNNDEGVRGYGEEITLDEMAEDESCVPPLEEQCLARAAALGVDTDGLSVVVGEVPASPNEPYYWGDFADSTPHLLCAQPFAAPDQDVPNNFSFELEAGDVYIGSESVDFLGLVRGTAFGASGDDSVSTLGTGTIEAGSGEFYGGDGVDGVRGGVGVGTTFSGGAGEDYVTSTNYGTVDGGDDADSMDENWGSFDGGAGDDTITGDNLPGASFAGGEGRDRIEGTLHGADFDNQRPEATFDAGPGDDYVGTNEAEFRGGAGHDYVGTNNSVFFGDDGDDRVGVNSGGGTFDGGDGHDQVAVNHGHFEAGSGFDGVNENHGFVTGGPDGDLVIENFGVVRGDAGTDRVSVNRAGATFYGGDDDDYVEESFGSVHGDGGNDRVEANQAGAAFHGGDGCDSVGDESEGLFDPEDETGCDPPSS